MSATQTRPKDADEVQSIVRESAKVLPRGAGTKETLSRATDDGVTIIEMGALSGVLEYEPGEYTITALAGTPVKDVCGQLAGHGQWLPFDPLLVERGATLGGTVAAGLSGPGRFRYGGIRDFLIGVRFVDGEGHLVRGGGKVVKNAAGFDFPKLLVGSLGRLGIMVELTFKVFPESEALSTLRFDYGGLDESVDALVRLSTSTLDLQALDLEPPGALVIRVGGVASGQQGRRQRVEQFLGRRAEVLEDDETYWRDARELRWVPEGATLLKIPLTPARIRGLDERIRGEMSRHEAPRRYSVGGNVAWLAWPSGASFDELEGILKELKLGAMVVWGRSGSPLIHYSTHAFGERVRQALDPTKRFLELA